MTDIEKVARAIWDQQRNHWGHYRDMVPDLCEWEELTQSKQRELMREAQAAIAAMQPVPQEPVAWMYEIAGAISTDINTGERNYTNWEQRLSTHKPCVEGSGVRNVAPLYAFPTPLAGGSDAER